MRLVFRGKPTQSRAELFEGYSRQFRRAVDAVFAADETPELADRLRANVSRFAAYKSVYVEGEFAKIAANQEYDAATRKAAMRAAEDRFARWTDAEYNTATARCRTAKQFSEFMEPDNRRLFPNLQWLATRSATPRADHAAFAGKIWPKTDPFWNSHAPGTEWNCKCDIAETDEPATDNSAVPDAKVPKGLEGNPYETGKVFTDDVGYIRNAPKTEAIVRAIGDFYYKNGDVQISCEADLRELSANIRTGQTIAKAGHDVKIAPHYDPRKYPDAKWAVDVKNPEYIIDGLKADAKRIQGEKGITDSFSKALTQGCQCVVIDYNMHNVKINVENTAKFLSRRFPDFVKGNINDCFLVIGEKTIKIDNTIFKQFPTDKQRFERTKALTEYIKKALE